ncbi:myelin-associated glycoprotein-like [Pseudochaenichthys georgianus]|uniref:myelin-associated glycoprotein-like n=1 Tax=Pseudochaenichthys georgianus TaxID=52239 RepID=UPI0039C309EE
MIEEEKEAGSSLVLNNVEPSSSGDYYCAAKNEHGDQNSTLIRLDIQYPPKNTSVSYSATVQEGSLLNLTCDGNANPAVYTWYKVNGGQVTDVGSGKRFSTTVSEVDKQFYCKVSNRYGTQNSSITQIDVQFPPKETTIITQHKGPLLEGSSVSLLCKSRANPPVTNYTWYKDDEEEKEAGSSLVLNNVEPSSSGDYYCAAKNEHGDQNSTLIRLDIQFPPEILSSSRCIKISSMIRCSCYSQGNPPPSLVWKLAGEPVNHSAAIPIREESLGNVGMKSIITLYDLDEDTLSLVCLSINSLGFDSFAFNMSLRKTEQGFHSLSFGIGFVVAALGMLLVCVPLLIIYYRKGKVISSSDKGKAETCNPVVTDVVVLTMSTSQML